MWCALRFLRILRAAATVLFLLLAIAVTVLWARSKLRLSDKLDYARHRPQQRATTNLSLESFDGIITLKWFTDPLPAALDDHTLTAMGIDPKAVPPLTNGFHYCVHHEPLRSTSSEWFWASQGFKFYVHNRKSSEWLSYGEVTLPHWLLFLIFSLLPVLRLRIHIRAYIRRRRGLCVTCGFDLRASPSQCPECGHCRQPSSTPAV